NLIADSVFKQVGKHYYAAQGTVSHGSFTHGSAAMKRILTQLGIDLSSAQIVDGSGLSRYNLLSAKQIADVLRLIHRDPRFSGLIASLPQAGISGTLQYRRGYTTAPLKELIFAKTGSMQGVANLAGFIRLPEQPDIVFVVLENGISPERKKLRKPAFNADFLSELVKSIGVKAPISDPEQRSSP
ncbi:MAG: D-alanyl-D-alanine carboxypeptidase/D-alanyl-D-alanine endopeptidase, partial [Shewanella sp.]